MAEELTDGEMAALSEEGLTTIANGGSVEDLSEDDLYRLSGQEKPGWFQENIGTPIAEKAGEIYGTLSSLSSDNVRMNALLSMEGEGKITPEEINSGKVKPGFGETLASASNLFLENAFDTLAVKEGDPKERRTGEVNPQILADLKAMDINQDQGLLKLNAVGMVKGKAFLWGDGNAGVLERLGDTLAAPEQAVARTAVGVLSEIGMIPREDAIEIMSQAQVDGHDIVDYFWVPKTATQKVGRGMLGFAADVVLDPLSYLTFGAGPVLRQAMEAGSVKIGNRVVRDPMLLARAERQALLAKNDIIRLVKTSGEVKNLEATESAIETLSKAVSEKGMQGLDGEVINKFTQANPELGEQVANIIRSRQTEKGVMRSLADGELSLNFGMRLPLTNIGFEQQIPLFGQGTRWGAEGALGVKDWAFSSASRVAGSLVENQGPIGSIARFLDNAGDIVSYGYQAMKTFTTRPLWDMSSNNYINKKSGNSAWATRQVNESIKEVGNDPETSDLMVKWLNQMPTHSDDELILQYAQPGEAGFNAAKSDLTKARALADETMARLELKNPAAARRVRLIREQFNERAAEMKKRGIPFNVLNPFDETIPVEERAMGYFPHILNPDYLDKKTGKPKYEAAMTAWEDHMAEMGLIDRTMVGRADRRSTHTIIDSVRKASGLEAPLFIDDPITASYSRMQDMDNIIAQHDMFKEIWPLAVIKNPGGKLGAMTEQYRDTNKAFGALDASFVDEVPRGFVEMIWEDYASAVFKKSGGPATMKTHMTEDLQAQAMVQFKSFLPMEYQMALKEKKKIFFPEDVATRLNYVMQREKAGVVRSAIDTYNYWFRNSALFGTGYQGMNTMGNLTTHMLARGELRQVPRASKFLWDARKNSAKVRDKIYEFGSGESKMSLSGEELYDTMADIGILGGSQTFEAAALSDDIWDNIATTRVARKGIIERVGNYLKKNIDVDTLSLFRTNRFLAEQNDNIFRAGLFFDSLEKGYTIQGAKERVGMYFYDFRDMPKGQRAVSRALPFSSFAMKTAESLALRAKKLDLKSATVPYYVNEILDGAFVDSYEERQTLRSSLPAYANDPVIGPALPGGKHILLEAPFIVNSVKSFMNPLDNLHPLVQSLSMAVAAASQADAPQDPDFEAARLESDTFKSGWDDFMGTQVANLLPPAIKIPMTLAQLKDPDEIRYLPLDFVKRYKSKTYAETSGSPMDRKLTTNAQEFGKYLRENVSPDWLYNSLMFGQLSNPGVDPERLGDKDAIFGNFVKSKMRDMTFGAARINDMDRTILTRMAAVQRQIQKTKSNIAKVNVDANVLRDPMASPKLMLKKSERGDRLTADGVAELTELYERQAALKQFYGYYLMQEKSGSIGLIDMVRNAMEPEKPLTAEEATDQNDLMRAAPAMEAGRIKGLELKMEGQ